MTSDFKVIAFGSSVGGIPPLRKILNELPNTINAAVIVVQHLSGEYDILQAA
ncbi:chemotaxis protein CheB [Chitinophaga sancti]|uniref:chemotaxis protein CheB n=1 Tax=Chitinophaga sancti TaxID=1004 RepID=UPI003F79670E